MIKYNCSENTKFPNLKFTCQGDKNKFAGITYIKGPLLKALTTKNTAFLLDEANLAPIEVLQALEAMIDCGYLVYEDKGKLIRIDVPKDFCCILTLNPSKGKFSGTRQELPESFKNKFISIEFPEMKREELYAITEGVSKAFGVETKVDNCKQFIDDFISFHWDWSQNEKIQDDVACLVIRDILAVLNIIVEGEDPTETIMNIYGARYIEPIKLEMKKLLFDKDSFKNYKENYDKIKLEFPKSCFINKNTLELISTCVFSLKHGRYPIIAGNNGSGKKLLACKLADYFNEYIAEKNIESDSNIMNLTKNNFEKSKNEEEMVYIVYCTKSSKVEDLMGKPRVSNNKNEDLIQWQDGPLIKAVKEGKPLILIGIHELQSSVLEYMNELLDRKYDGKQRYLNNPNNPNEPSIPVHKNFRLICTTLLSELNKLSPAFATRMDIKILNDQLENITEEELFSFIKTCMNNVKSELLTYEEDMQKRLEELKEELKMNQSKQTDKNRSDSVDSNHSSHSKKSIDSKKSNKSQNSAELNNSKKEIIQVFQLIQKNQISQKILKSLIILKCLMIQKNQKGLMIQKTQINLMTQNIQKSLMTQNTQKNLVIQNIQKSPTIRMSQYIMILRINFLILKKEGEVLLIVMKIMKVIIMMWKIQIMMKIMRNNMMISLKKSSNF